MTAPVDRDDQDGLTLARAYWQQVVRPLLDETAPGLPRSAARIGSGSEVLGLDDAMSRDHDWGLRLQLIVPPTHQARIRSVLLERLPPEFAGHPARIRFTGTDEEMPAVDVLTLDELVETRLGFDPGAGGRARDWLSLTGQTVLVLTAGEVFEDTGGRLHALRSALAWYPDDVWRYVVASDWHRLDQELPLMGRAGDRGDDLGSRVIAARLVDVAMHLGFSLCRRWAPYSKWRGTLFGRLPLPDRVGRHLAAAMTATDWRGRGAELAAALDLLAEVQTQVGLPATTPACVPFWERPYLRVDPRLVPDLLADIRDPEVRAEPAGLGSIEQRSDNVDLLMHADRRRQAVGATTLG